MKTLFGTLIAMWMLSASTALAGGGLMFTEDCRDKLYTEGGAHSYSEAQAVCFDRSDAGFVDCVVDRYRDPSQSHSFATAVSVCRTRVPGAGSMQRCQESLYRSGQIEFNVSRQACYEGRQDEFYVCVSDARRAGFSSFRAGQLCQWTTERSVYLCIDRKVHTRNQNPESALQGCFNEFNRGELNQNGENRVEIERERQEAARRAAIEAQRRAQEEAARRAAEEARRRNNPPPPPPVRPSQPARPAPPAPPVKRPLPPTEPTKPSQPSQPARPAEPAKPAPPAKPSVPAKPAEPAKPSQPAPSKPVEQKPTQPAPSKPAEPAQPEPSRPQPPQVPPACADTTQGCGDGVIVDLPNL